MSVIICALIDAPTVNSAVDTRSLPPGLRV